MTESVAHCSVWFVLFVALVGVAVGYATSQLLEWSNKAFKKHQRLQREFIEERKRMQVALPPINNVRILHKRPSNDVPPPDAAS